MYRAALFEEFRQLGNGAARTTEGSGVGLRTRFVELRRGASPPGKNSTFDSMAPVRV